MKRINVLILDDNQTFLDHYQKTQRLQLDESINKILTDYRNNYEEDNG